MGSGAGVRFGRAALIALALAGVTPRALACIYAPGGWGASIVPSVPANGVIVVGYGCPFDCGDGPPPGPETILLSDPTGKALPGTFVRQIRDTNSVLFAFKPDVELTVGGEYTVRFEDGPLFGLTVTPPATWSLEPELHDEPYRVERPSGSPSCCDSSLDLCNLHPCHYHEVLRTTGVRVDWDLDRPPQRSQYAHRFISPGQPDPEWQFDAADAPQTEDIASSVCYTLELLRLVDGTVHSYEQRCVERPADFEPIGIFPVDPAAITMALQRCDTPPIGEDAAWCSANAAVCSTNFPDKCATYTRLCSAGTGGRSGSGGDSAGGNDSAGDAPNPRDDQLAEGCTCSTPAGRPGRASFSLLALAVALLGARRRRAWRRRIDPTTASTVGEYLRARPCVARAMHFDNQS